MGWVGGVERGLDAFMETLSTVRENADSGQWGNTRGAIKRRWQRACVWVGGACDVESLTNLRFFWGEGDGGGVIHAREAALFGEMRDETGQIAEKRERGRPRLPLPRPATRLASEKNNAKSARGKKENMGVDGRESDVDLVFFSQAYLYTVNRDLGSVALQPRHPARAKHPSHGVHVGGDESGRGGALRA